MRYSLFIVFILFSTLKAIAQVGELLWEDNFNTGQLNLENWNIETGTGVNGDFGTGQVDRATNREENISFSNDEPGAEDGCLVITTRKEFYIDRNYTSARLNTAGKKSWGPGHRIVARIHPRNVKQMGQGFAFWMMPDEIPAGWNSLMWPQGGEIDIMEYVGSIPFHNLGSVHYAWFWQNNEWADWNHGHKGFYYSYETQQVPNPAEPSYGNYPPDENDPNAGSYGFHEYGIDWYSDRIEFFIDDNVYHIHYLNDGGAFSIDGEDQSAVLTREGKRVGISEYSNHFYEWHPFEHKMYPILSAGVTGSDYSYGGPVNAEAEFPCSVFIDWLRVYKLDINVGISQTASREFQIYPNPAKENLTVSCKTTGEYNVKLLDIAGKPVMQGTFSNTTEINTSGYTKGLYLVKIENGRQSYSEKILIN
ncbi:T9SS type A sorting domain-containing protein [Draconibacterium sp. IB214405]|uniref:T9SS type A sorting domain-containing protein n=1 Tax=Draconibacterium sp. IB214405 TaxID=3097352 RepID=UPI002A14587C|nr:T9SS type A sorting domain-containing protein [Draconibacterium sp. IB214405]MDX8337562.1 T9SS type A sorting domain-containing protein [Draconibacterium sp. IB214405]